MTETSRFWGGTATGDAASAPYDAEAEFAEVLRSIAAAHGVTTDKSGVFRDEENELAVTGGSGQVSVNTGRALVDGTWYKNDASVNVAVATPAGATRIDRIVLRKDFAAKTVRITKIDGAEGGGAPALVQSAGVTWDAPLAQVSITTGGVITVTDQRDFIPWHGDQTGEAGIKHSWSQITGAPSGGSGGGGDLIFGQAGAAGASPDFAPDDHGHDVTEETRGIFAAVSDGESTTSVTYVDTELSVSLPANASYLIRGVIYAASATPVNINLTMDGPSGSTILVAAEGIDPADSVTPLVELLGGGSIFELTTSNRAIRFEGVVDITTAGDLVLQYAAATAGTVTITAGTMTATQLP